MPEHRSIRLSDADDPDRQDKFMRALKKHAVNGNQTIRLLINAWLLHVREHGRPPTFPVRLVEIDPPKKQR
jgi:hypothetical protein